MPCWCYRLFLLLVVTSHIAIADPGLLYRWTDGEGRAHRPPAPARRNRQALVVPSYAEPTLAPVDDLFDHQPVQTHGSVVKTWNVNVPERRELDRGIWLRGVNWRPVSVARFARRQYTRVRPIPRRSSATTRPPRAPWTDTAHPRQVCGARTSAYQPPRPPPARPAPTGRVPQTLTGHAPPADTRSIRMAPNRPTTAPGLTVVGQSAFRLPGPLPGESAARPGGWAGQSRELLQVLELGHGVDLDGEQRRRVDLRRDLGLGYLPPDPAGRRFHLPGQPLPTVLVEAGSLESCRQSAGTPRVGSRHRTLQY